MDLHLRQGHYSDWLNSIVKDKELAQEVSGIERDLNSSPAESRKRIRQAIESRYTAAA